MKKRVLLILAGVALFAFIVSMSFVWYTFFYRDTFNGNISSVEISISNDNNTISEGNSIPLSKEEASKLKPYEFKVVNKKNNLEYYRVIIEDAIISDDVNYTNKDLLDRSQLEYKLMLNGKEIKSGMLSNIKNNILDTRSLEANMSNHYQLWVYVSEKAQNTAWQNKYYHFTVKVRMEEN